MNADDYAPSNDLPRQCSVTPRTDAIPRRGPFHHYRVEDVLKVCKQLERELASLQSARDEERGDPIVDTSYTGQIASLKAALAKRDREIEKLRSNVCWFLTAEEQQAVKELCETQDLAPQGVLRQALRLYQMNVKGPLRMSMLPEPDGVEGLLNDELARLRSQLQAATSRAEEADAPEPFLQAWVALRNLLTRLNPRK